jgi:CBS domain containing-hemolysin-like protein
MGLNKTPPEPIRLPKRRIVRRVVRKPTPIRISVMTWRLILLGLAALLVLFLWAVPVVPAVALAGFAIALVLSFLVHLFVQYVPRSLAILFSFLILLAVLLLFCRDLSHSRRSLSSTLDDAYLGTDGSGSHPPHRLIAVLVLAPESDRPS